jgi:hypothetical protein
VEHGGSKVVLGLGLYAAFGAIAWRALSALLCTTGWPPSGRQGTGQGAEMLESEHAGREVYSGAQ